MSSKRYVITDPCYILPRETWDECIEKCKAFESEDNWSTFFHKTVEQALHNLTKGQAFVESTGFGDWSNCLHGPCVHNTGAFCADSGTVCVCEYTDEVKEILGDSCDDCYALFDAEGPLQVNFNKEDRDWTVVEIEDANGDEWYTDIPYDEDEDE